ncbi:unnamed protein product, partial [Porites lobata]
GNIGQENVCYYILERKNAFLGNIGQENVSYYILKRKNAFLGYLGQENVFYDILERENLIFGGVLTSHEKMFDEVGNDSVMRQACFVYTVRDLF